MNYTRLHAHNSDIGMVLHTTHPSSNESAARVLCAGLRPRTGARVRAAAHPHALAVQVAIASHPLVHRPCGRGHLALLGSALGRSRLAWRGLARRGRARTS
jgi:hypothetical protein